MNPILTPGGWEALIHNTPDQAKHLVVRLAVHHGHMEPPGPPECPRCNTTREPSQMLLGDV